MSEPTTATSLDVDPVMAAGDWNTNADMVVDVERLGYLQREWLTLDCTYGLGRFWKRWRPDRLLRHDIAPECAPDGPVDARHLPYRSGVFDAAVVDGPYKLNGTTSGASDQSYGVHVPASRDGRHELICDMIAEAVRVLRPPTVRPARPGGVLLVKCQDQVNGGRNRWQTRIFSDHAESLGCRLVDQLHLRSYRPQPPGRRQVHARRNYSTLLVFRQEADES